MPTPSAQTCESFAFAGVAMIVLIAGGPALAERIAQSVDVR